MSIKLIALDLDGTTLNDKGIITTRTKDTLGAAADLGVYIVVATGRPFTALPSDIFDVPAIRYVITSNGAEITDLASNKVIYRNCMSANTAEKSVELLRKYPYIIEAFTKGEAFMQGDYYRQVQETGESFRSVDYLLRTRKPIDDILGFILEHKDEIENINVNFEDPSEKDEMRTILETIPGATITSSLKNNLEIGGETTSKAEALRFLCEILQVTRQETMAAGDSPNDGAMLQEAGLAVVMGNGEEEVKAMADFVTLPNSEDGVAHAIEKLVLGDK